MAVAELGAALSHGPYMGLGISWGTATPLSSERFEQSLCYLTRAELCWV